MDKQQTAANAKFDLVEAIDLQLGTMNITRLKKVQKYCNLLMSEQVELYRELQTAPATPPKPKREVKNGWKREIRNIRNRANGQNYLWEYEQLYKDGKRVKGKGTCKSIGRVK